MKKFVRMLLALAMLFGLASVVSAATPKVFLVGDSTVSPFNDPYYYPRFGWGTKIGDYLEKVEVVNYALSGRSSKSFLKEMNYRNLRKEIGKGDYLFIAFGHNDEKNDGERYANCNGSITDEGSFKNILFEKYIKLAKDAKATPILCTPIVRRSPEGVYEGSYVHNTKDVEGFPGGDYSQAIRDLAAETNTFLIDNTAMTKELYESLGSDGTIKLHAWIKHRPESVDNTHLNTYGASYVAYLVANALQDTKCKLKKFVKKNIQPPVEVLVLEKNPQYTIPKYEPPTAESASTYWTVSAPWMGTVFGDCGDQISINPEKGAYEITATASGVSMRSGIEGGKSIGKIASASDGIAFYFQMLPIQKDFTFTAKAHVKFASANNQVSFGLMVRDDVYIDKYDNSVSSQYVAAGPLKLANGADFSSSWSRQGGKLVENKNQGSKVPAKGDTVDLKIVKKGNEYSLQYGSEAPVVVQLDLNEVDKDNIFAGLYTVRNAAVEFTDIKLDVK